MKQLEQNRYAVIMDALQIAVDRAGDYVTAGQVAKEARLSRNTAKKYLDKLYNDDRIDKVRGEHVNRQEKAGYKPFAPCPHCGGTKRVGDGWTEERGYGALYRHWEVICGDCGEYLDGGIIDLQD